MSIVTVGLGARSYDIVIEDGALDRAGVILAPFARDKRLVIVTEETVAAAVLPRLTNALAEAGITADPIILDAVIMP